MKKILRNLLMVAFFVSALSMVAACGGGGGGGVWFPGGGADDGGGDEGGGGSDTLPEGEWTWMAGFPEADVVPYYTGAEYGVPADNIDPGSRAMSAIWDDGNGNLWLFGGWNVGTDPYSDLWKFDGENWAWMAGPSTSYQAAVYGTKGVAGAGNTPGARSGSVTWVDDEGNLWLFGGLAMPGSFLNDLWMFDGTDWTWVSGSDSDNQFGAYGTKGVAGEGNVPGARYAAVSWKDAEGNFWLFGGLGYSVDGVGELNDLWKFDGENWTWVSGSDVAGALGDYGTRGVTGPTNEPRARVGASSWTDDQGVFWLFGGKYDGDMMSDVWKFDGTNWTWMHGWVSEVSPFVTGSESGAFHPDNTPGSRTGAFVWVDDQGDAWLFGGFGRDYSGQGYFSDLWKFNGHQWAWVHGLSFRDVIGVWGTKGISSDVNKPSGRYFGAAWRDADGNFRLFGGIGRDIDATEGVLSDLWRFVPPAVADVD